MYSVFFGGVLVFGPGQPEALTAWKKVLDDQSSLLECPGRHHKALVQQAHALHRARVVDLGGLSDLLDLADAALEYAIEIQLDPPKPPGLLTNWFYKGPMVIEITNGDRDQQPRGVDALLVNTGLSLYSLSMLQGCPADVKGHTIKVTLPDGYYLDGPVTWSTPYSLVFSIGDEWGIPRFGPYQGDLA